MDCYDARLGILDLNRQDFALISRKDACDLHGVEKFVDLTLLLNQQRLVLRVDTEDDCNQQVSGRLYSHGSTVLLPACPEPRTLLLWTFDAAPVLPDSIAAAFVAGSASAAGSAFTAGSAASAPGHADDGRIV